MYNHVESVETMKSTCSILAKTMKDTEALGKAIDFTGVLYRKPTQAGGNCLWCRYGKLMLENPPIRLKCTYENSKNLNKTTKFPQKRSCKEWRYKF